MNWLKQNWFKVILIFLLVLILIQLIQIRDVLHPMNQWLLDIKFKLEHS